MRRVIWTRKTRCLLHFSIFAKKITVFAPGPLSARFLVILPPFSTPKVIENAAENDPGSFLGPFFVRIPNIFCDADFFFVPGLIFEPPESILEPPGSIFQPPGWISEPSGVVFGASGVDLGVQKLPKTIRKPIHPASAVNKRSAAVVGAKRLLNILIICIIASFYH